MCNLTSSTELLKIGTFWYRLNITRNKPLNWLPVVKKAKIAEKIASSNCNWRTTAGHHLLLILCNPDWTSSLPWKNLMLNWQDKTSKLNTCKYVAVGDRWNVLVFYTRYLFTSNELRTSLTQNILSHWGCNSRQESQIYTNLLCVVSHLKKPN